LVGVAEDQPGHGVDGVPVLGAAALRPALPESAQLHGRTDQPAAHSFRLVLVEGEIEVRPVSDSSGMHIFHLKD
jgi:hypothetical protein